MPLWRDTMSVMTVGQCPVCFELTYLSLIEPHATRNDVEWRTFACSKCGPVKAVLMPIKGYRPGISGLYPLMGMRTALTGPHLEQANVRHSTSLRVACGSMRLRYVNSKQTGHWPTVMTDIVSLHKGIQAHRIERNATMAAA